jgi:hypothetical protein
VKERKKDARRYRSGVYAEKETSSQRGKVCKKPKRIHP